MLDWLKNKQHPPYWQKYLSLFENEDKKVGEEKRFVIFDTETTGLDVQNDVVLSIGAVGIIGDSIVVKDYLEIYIEQEKFDAVGVTVHGILRNGKETKISEEEAMTLFLDYIGNATLVGHHVHFDVAMVNEILERLDLGKLKNETFDTDLMYQKWKNIMKDTVITLDELCDIFKVSKSHRHTAAGDSFIIALIFLKLKARLGLK
ncbi:exonuclease domain-containing protein [Flavobacterium sp. '19STA2R22 D10 B1']|uniref:exonuclease domain-containing protein n=1 Tax=Flavobacterium aerium TaxID=3037261 RepID=UPI00278BC142|nr:exonuclease domain-containing protein [Flavobacterium sp. '19STA2R22 D10 B1']